MSAQTVGGRYQVERSLGHGGMATVHLARDEDSAGMLRSNVFPRR